MKKLKSILIIILCLSSISFSCGVLSRKKTTACLILSELELTKNQRTKIMEFVDASYNPKLGLDEICLMKLEQANFTVLYKASILYSNHFKGFYILKDKEEIETFICFDDNSCQNKLERQLNKFNIKEKDDWLKSLIPASDF